MMNWLQLTHKTAIVTGAGSGIGSATAKALAQQGCNLLLVDIHDENIQTVSKECQHIQQQHSNLFGTTTATAGRDALKSRYYVGDVTNQDQVHDMIQCADDLARGVHIEYQNAINQGDGVPPPPPTLASILINSAGITRDGLIQNISESDYDKVLNINLKGTFLTCQAFCDTKRLDLLCGPMSMPSRSIEEDGNKNDIATNSNGGGSIINIGSIISELGNVGQCNYAASKGGVLGLTRSLAKECSFHSTKMTKTVQNGTEDSNYNHHHTVRVNAILPGFIDTPMSLAVPTHIRERIKNNIPMKRFGTVDDVANLALFLASTERSGYVTGECWSCSGMISL